MKRIIFSLSLLLSCTALFAQAINDANAQARDVKEFHSIVVTDGIDVYLTQGDEESLAVSAGDRKFVNQIKTEIRNGVLTIRHDGGDIHHANPRKMKLKAYISFAKLDDLDLGPGCHAYALGEWKDAELKKRLLKTMK